MSASVKEFKMSASVKEFTPSGGFKPTQPAGVFNSFQPTANTGFVPRNMPPPQGGMNAGGSSFQPGAPAPQ